MKYALNFSNSESTYAPALLEDGLTRAMVASECRTAALDFMAGVAEGWTKFDLALWLHGPYALAARHSQAGDRAPVSGKRPIESWTIEQLLVQVRGQILAALELGALNDGRLDFIEDALLEGHVSRVIDDDGENIWVPVDCGRMRLRDRVMSLFAADYLNGPREYVHLHVCHHCEAITFDHGARAHKTCGAHRRVSGVMPCIR